jgi:hypothetical protein
MMLSDAQNYVSAIGSVQHDVYFFEMFADMFFDGWGDGEISSCVFNFHPDAPWLSPPAGNNKRARLEFGNV